MNPASNLGSDVPPALHVSHGTVAGVVAPPALHDAKRAAKIIVRIVTDPSDASGVYYDENGRPMSGSTQIQDPAYADRYVTESRDLLASLSA